MTPATISNNVHRLADEYRSFLRSILVEQAASGCLCLCPDLWSGKHRKVNYLGLTAVFVDTNHELFSVDLCCCEYEENDKTSESVLRVSISIERQYHRIRKISIGYSFSIGFIWIDIIHGQQ